ncbi:type II secretion system protein GspM [Colwellia sp. MEBiC06753]
MAAWQNYSDKFLALTKREQHIVLWGGLFLIIYLIFSLVLEPNLKAVNQQQQRILGLNTENQTTVQANALFAEALSEDPDRATVKQIEQKKQMLASIDQQLLTLTSDLINPIQMRIALTDLLALTPGVSLTSFELLPANALFVNAGQVNEQESSNESNNAQLKNKLPQSQAVGLYKHAIKLTLNGKYQALQQFLAQAEQLKWKFFWQNFQLNVVQYPNNELSVTMYSLSTKQEFIGV